MKSIKNNNILLFVLLTILFISCNSDDDSNDSNSNPTENINVGPGTTSFNYSTSNGSKSLNVFYYVPENTTQTAPLVFVLHGAGRNAEDYRNSMITKANEYGFIAIAPEFSQTNYPGGDGYNLGNVFEDGDNPSPDTLNQEMDWAFSIIEPLFDYMKNEINNTNNSYYMYGHSAGGQFVHRFLMFKPNARVYRAVASASGWYTFPDSSITFPYGFNESLLQSSSLDNLFSKNLIIQVGENDNDPNSPGLRHNQFADAQGLNRLERAVNFFEFSQNLAQEQTISFNWELYINNDADHDYITASQSAADLLFN